MEERQKILRISVRRLVEFLLRSGSLESRSGPSREAAMREGARIHRQIQKKEGEGYRAEVPLKLEIPLTEDSMPVLPVFTQAPSSGLFLCLEGRADGIFKKISKRTFKKNGSDSDEDTDPGGSGKDIIVIDEIKTVFRGLQEMREPEEVHLAQARCYAYIYAVKEGLDRIGIRMTYSGQVTGEIRYFYEEQSFEELSQWFISLIREYGPWIKRKLSFEESAVRTIRAGKFPFHYREGQFDLAAGVYRTIVHGRKLFLQAPTGTGKTLAVLFPALKAVGEGKAEKIFYLTAKNVTGRVALESLRLLYERGLCIRSLELVSKERS